MSANRLLRRGVMIVVLLAAVVGVVPASPSSPVAAQSSGLGAGGEYHPLTPTRILDTREAPPLDVAPRGKKPTSAGSGSSFNFPVLGRGGVPADADDVLAVVMSLIVVEPDQGGHMTVYPKGASAGTSSLINFLPNRNVPNVAILGVGADGSVTANLRTVRSGRAHVVADVYGWISKSAATERGARVVPVTPGRIYDSRKQGGALGSRSSIALPIRGAVGRDANYNTTGRIVPDRDTVTGVIVNITAINNLRGSGPTYMSMSPERVGGATGAPTSNVNVARGQIKPVMAIVPVASDGRVHLYNYAGPTHVAVDVLGYLEEMPNDTTTAGRIVPLDSPFRAFDTRRPEFGNVPLGTRQAENWSFKAFAGSVTLKGQPIGAQKAVFGNLTGTGLQRRVSWLPVSTYLSMYPGGRSRPFISNINLVENENVPNMALVTYGTAKNASGVDDPYVAQAFNYNGSLHYLFDVYAVVLK